MTAEKNDKSIVARAQLEALENENRNLKVQVALLEKRLSFLEAHQTLASGMRGETLISQMLDGVMTSHTAPFDVTLRDGIRIEVKIAKLNRAVRQYATRRWAWGRVLGGNNSKTFDYLILIGEKDEVYADRYLDKLSPYVFYLIPKDDVLALTTKTAKVRGIFLSTNPATAKSVARDLFTKYQTTAEQLKIRFGL